MTKPKRNIQSSELMMNLLLGGRPLRCEVEGCTCVNEEDLEIHHIVPVSVHPIHSLDNLVLLCEDHHALVERFYWWERSKLMPEEAREIKELAKLFKARAILPRDLPASKERTSQLWKALNAHPKCANPTWWRKVYGESKKWALEQEVVRKVNPRDAIIEDPWFRKKAECLEAAEAVVLG